MILDLQDYPGLMIISRRGRGGTYDNQQKGERNVKVRLDRAVVSPGWSQLF
jgi:hypothetical protein